MGRSLDEKANSVLRESVPIARTLEGGALLDEMSDEEILKRVNGLGAQWADWLSVMGLSLSDAMNLRFRWAIPASIIHDIRYSQGGNADDRRYADDEFHRNLLSLAGNPWNPRTWLRIWEAGKMHRLVRSFGFLAFYYDKDCR